MKRLSREAFDRARQFLKTQARPLDRAMFEYRFESAPAEAVLAELVVFQNEDGGFGHALEPDVRTPSSSALATGIGLRILQELDTPSDHPMVSQAVNFLLSTFDHGANVWRVVPYDTNDYPHAGWWHDEDNPNKRTTEGRLTRTFDGFQVIPRAELVALLHHFVQLRLGTLRIPIALTKWLEDLAEHTVKSIEDLEALGSGGGDTLVYALRLAETDALPQALKDRLLARLRDVVPEAVEHNPQKWDTYCILPLKIAPSPQSLVADLLWDDLQAHLDYQIDHQSPAGIWEPSWTWGDAYPEAWEQAKLEWRGHLTLETLTTLEAFSRLCQSKRIDL